MKKYFLAYTHRYASGNWRLRSYVSGGANFKRMDIIVDINSKDKLTFLSCYSFFSYSYTFKIDKLL